MPTYYGHKPSWKQARDAGQGARRTAAPPVLEMNRSPSGGYQFEGRTYTPDPRSSGRPSVPVVPQKNSWGGGEDNRYPSERRAAQRMARAKAIARFAPSALAAANFINDVAAAANWNQSDWDNFMGDGTLPAPFDWLNPDPSNPIFGGLPVNQKSAVPMPAGSIYTQDPSGKWWGVAPPFAGGFQGTVVQTLNNTTWPPPGTTNSNNIGHWSARKQFADPINYPVDRAPATGWRKVPYGAYLAFYRGNWWNVQAGTPVPNFEAWAIGMEEYIPFNFPDPPAPAAGVLVPTPVRQSQGATLVEAQNPVTSLPAFISKQALLLNAPMWPQWGIAIANAVKQAQGVQFRESEDTDDWNGATPGEQTVIPPAGPVIIIPTKPGLPPGRPTVGTKEKKGLVGKGLLSVAQTIFHGITEYGDVVDALFDAIPRKQRCKTKSLVGKSVCVATHLDSIDIGDAIVNIAWNQFEDWAIGRGLFETNVKAARARGDRYAFRTLNSVNGYGGIDELGELYGDFSQSYVEPNKDKLKKYLTERFGF